MRRSFDRVNKPRRIRPPLLRPSGKTDRPRDTPEIGMILEWNGLLAHSLSLSICLSLFLSHAHSTYSHTHDGGSLVRWLVSAQLRDTRCVRLASNAGSPPQLNSRVFLCPRIFTAAPLRLGAVSPTPSFPSGSLSPSLSLFLSVSFSACLVRCAHKRIL